MDLADRSRLVKSVPLGLAVILLIAPGCSDGITEVTRTAEPTFEAIVSEAQVGANGFPFP